jgi:hypothetical protein
MKVRLRNKNVKFWKWNLCMHMWINEQQKKVKFETYVNKITGETAKLEMLTLFPIEEPR